MKKWIGLLVLMTFFTLNHGEVQAENVVDDDIELIEMDVTCYCPESCPGTITATGTHVREGILACNPRLGQTAIVWTTDMKTCLGIFQAEDKGGAKGLRKGTQIDIWKPDLKSAKEVMKLTGGKVLVQWIPEAVG